MAIKIPIVSVFDAKGLRQAQKAFGDLKGNLMAATKVIAGVGVAIGGLAAISIKKFGDFDAALTKSTAIMGDLSDEMRKKMSDTARIIAKETTFSADQAAEAYFFLASAGLDAASSVAALPQVAQFAQAGMFDLALATDLLTDAQSALGMVIKDDAVANLKEMTRLSDVLVKANTLANASVEQFSTALTTKAGAALKALGKDVTEGVAVLAAFADQGIKGEIAGTQLSIVLRDLTTKAIQNKSAFKAMGVEVFDNNGKMNNLGDIIGNLEDALAGMSDETQKATLLQMGFSDKSLSSLQALMGTSDAIKQYEEDLRSASGFTSDVAGKQLETFNAQLALLGSAFEDVALEVGEELTPYLQELIPIIQKELPKAADMIMEAIKGIDFESLIKGIIDSFGWLIKNGEKILTVAGYIAGFIAVLWTLSTVIKAVAAAQAIWNIIISANPIGLIVIGIAALIAVIVLVVNYLVEMYGGWDKLFADIGGWVDNFVKGFGDAMKQVGKFFTDVFKGFGDFFKAIINVWIGLFEGFINFILGGVNGIISGLNLVLSGIKAATFGAVDLKVSKIPTVKIPRLAEGGLVMPRPGGLFANIAEAGQPEAVIPLDRLNEFKGKGDVIYNINVSGGLDSSATIGQAIVTAIRNYERQSGAAWRG
jgi:TP901 family phage tail tape measure protein